MLQTLNSSTHGDVEFIINGKIVYAHKTILSIRSAYFLAMFDGGMKESREKSVRMEDLEQVKNKLNIIFRKTLIIISYYLKKKDISLLKIFENRMKSI